MAYFKASIKRSGFMGWTHFLTSFAIVLLMNMFWPIMIPTFGLDGWQYVLIFILVLTLTSGSSLWPDIDNDPSTVTNKLGLLGFVLSKLMGFISAITYNTFHTKKDKTKSKTHRLIWHTPFAWILIGAGFYFTIPNVSTSGYDILKDSWQSNLSLAIFAVVALISIWIALGFMLPKSVRKLTLIPAAGLAFFMLTLPASNIRGLVICVSFGAILHILEDLLSQGSVPILFPIPIMGKLWWKPWVLGPFQIYTGGHVERIITLVAGIASVALAGITIWRMAGFA